jgi:hypothetical protein
VIVSKAVLWVATREGDWVFPGSVGPEDGFIVGFWVGFLFGFMVGFSVGDRARV